jgi:hypothetical protein
MKYIWYSLSILFGAAAVVSAIRGNWMMLGFDSYVVTTAYVIYALLEERSDVKTLIELDRSQQALDAKLIQMRQDRHSFIDREVSRLIGRDV